MPVWTCTLFIHMKKWFSYRIAVLFVYFLIYINKMFRNTESQTRKSNPSLVKLLQEMNHLRNILWKYSFIQNNIGIPLWHKEFPEYVVGQEIHLHVLDKRLQYLEVYQSRNLFPFQAHRPIISHQRAGKKILQVYFTVLQVIHLTKLIKIFYYLISCWQEHSQNES